MGPPASAIPALFVLTLLPIRDNLALRLGKPLPSWGSSATTVAQDFPLQPHRRTCGSELADPDLFDARESPLPITFRIGPRGLASMVISTHTPWTRVALPPAACAQHQAALWEDGTDVVVLAPGMILLAEASSPDAAFLRRFVCDAVEPLRSIPRPRKR